MSGDGCLFLTAAPSWGRTDSVCGSVSMRWPGLLGPAWATVRISGERLPPLHGRNLGGWWERRGLSAADGMLSMVLSLFGLDISGPGLTSIPEDRNTATRDRLFIHWIAANDIHVPQAEWEEWWEGEKRRFQGSWRVARPCRAKNALGTSFSVQHTLPREPVRDLGDRLPALANLWLEPRCATLLCF